MYSALEKAIAERDEAREACRQHCEKWREALDRAQRAEKALAEAQDEAEKWRITSDAHCSVIMDAEDILAPLKLGGLDLSDKAEAVVKRLAEQRERLLEPCQVFADSVERDRREQDKLLCHLQTFRRALREAQEVGE